MPWGIPLGVAAVIALSDAQPVTAIAGRRIGARDCWDWTSSDLVCPRRDIGYPVGRIRVGRTDSRHAGDDSRTCASDRVCPRPLGGRCHDGRNCWPVRGSAGRRPLAMVWRTQRISYLGAVRAGRRHRKFPSDALRGSRTYVLWKRGYSRHRARNQSGRGSRSNRHWCALRIPNDGVDLATNSRWGRRSRAPSSGVLSVRELLARPPRLECWADAQGPRLGVVGARGGAPSNPELQRPGCARR